MTASIRRVILIVHPPEATTSEGSNTLPNADTGSEEQNQGVDIEVGPPHTDQTSNQHVAVVWGSEYPGEAVEVVDMNVAEYQHLDPIQNASEINEYRTEGLRTRCLFPISNIRTPVDEPCKICGAQDEDSEHEAVVQTPAESGLHARETTQYAAEAEQERILAASALLELAQAWRDFQTAASTSAGRGPEPQSPASTNELAAANESAGSNNLSDSHGTKRSIRENQFEDQIEGDASKRRKTVIPTAPKACEEPAGVANVKTRLEVGPSSGRADSAPHHKANPVEIPNDAPKPAEESAPGADGRVVSRGKVHGMALRLRRGLNVKESSGN